METNRYVSKCLHISKYILQIIATDPSVLHNVEIIYLHKQTEHKVNAYYPVYKNTVHEYSVSHHSLSNTM